MGVGGCCAVYNAPVDIVQVLILFRFIMDPRVWGRCYVPLLFR